MNNIIFLLLSFLLISCSGKKQSGPRLQKVYFGGDVRKFFEGTNNNNEISLEDYDSGVLDGLELEVLQNFIARGKINSNAEQTNDYDKDFLQGQYIKSTDEEVKFEFSPYDSGLIIYSAVNFENNCEGAFAFLFQKTQTGLKLQKTITCDTKGNQKKSSIKDQHISVKENKTGLSILVYLEQNKTQVLHNFFFKRPNPEYSERTYSYNDSRYIGLNKELNGGSENRIIWKEDPKNLKIHLCGINSDVVRADIIAGVKLWEDALENQIAIEVIDLSNNYPPFSDLNVHCVYILDDFVVTSPSEKGFTKGFNLSTYNSDDGTIFSSDIFYNKKEIEDLVEHYYKNNIIPYKLSFEEFLRFEKKVFPHEFGHFLGLGHQFDEDIPSIMSYQDEETFISDYDKQAIFYFYGLTDQTPAPSSQDSFDF
jgi:hypothetical protein